MSIAHFCEKDLISLSFTVKDLYLKQRFIKVNVEDAMKLSLPLATNLLFHNNYLNLSNATI